MKQTNKQTLAKQPTNTNQIKFKKQRQKNLISPQSLKFGNIIHSARCCIIM